jgi:hypothetical protein
VEKYRYRAFSLCLESDIPLSELCPYDGEKIDVHISLCSGPIVANSFELIDFYIPSVGHFYIHAGKYIWVWPDPNAHLNHLKLFILGSCMGAILHQRGNLVLHGNAVEIGDSCSVFLGPSGNGKSTLAGAFIKQGYRVLTDDICAISFQHGIPYVIPGYPQIKLWRDSAETLGQDLSKLNSIYDRSDKFALPIADSFANQSLPIQQIIILNTWKEQRIELKQITGIHQFQAIFGNTYRQNFIRRIKQDQRYFELCNQLVHQIPIFSLTRPKVPYRLDELISTVLNHPTNRRYYETRPHLGPA